MSETQTPLASDEIEVMPRVTQIMRAPAQDLMLTPAFDLETAQKRLVELQKFVEFYLKENEDYGKIPGTPKPTLFKSGADKLCDIYALADTYKLTNRTEDWDLNLFDYEVECTLLSKRTMQLVASGLGSCNSYEGKYRWREQQRKCPSCQKELIIKGKGEYGGGWLCWKKKGGCGATFKDGDKSIEGQTVGKIQNEDIPTLKNTILKMAKKRAKVDAVLSATRSSGLFTQDMDDIQQVEQHENGTKAEQQLVVEHKLNGAVQKKVDLYEMGEGFFRLDGDGFNTVLLSIPDPARKQLGMEWTGKFWTMLGSSAFAFEDICKKQGIGLHYVALNEQLEKSVKTTAPKTPEPQAPAVKHPVAPGSGNITNVELAENKRTKSPFMRVWQEGRKMQVFDNQQMKLPDGTTMALFDMLIKAKGKEAIFNVNKSGEYLNIVGVQKLGRLRWDEAGEVMEAV